MPAPRKVDLLPPELKRWLEAELRTRGFAGYEALAEAAAARKRWEFMLMVAPLLLPKATGSPVNPIAVF